MVDTIIYRQVTIVLTVKTPDEAARIIHERFPPLTADPEECALFSACGRVLHTDIAAEEHVPGFDRSTVDGYAVAASDTFGCSASNPALLTLADEVPMGQAADRALTPGACFAVSTGGGLPNGSDAVVMLEDAEDYGDGTVGVTSPTAPGNNVIFKGDDVSPGDVILRRGAVLAPHDIGILSAMGIVFIKIRPKPRTGIISTGDELVKASEKPGRGQIRDVNTPLLSAAVNQFGAAARSFGMTGDDGPALRLMLIAAAAESDIVLISGGSSAGMRDMTARVIGSEGTVLFHGIAVKPGKPTILGDICGKPVFGLPGHPAAAYFVTEIFVRPLIMHLMGAVLKRRRVAARTSVAVPSNHGREEYIAVVLDGTAARPVRSKSGLITGLAGTDGYICVPRDSEGLPKGAEVAVTLWG